MNKLFFSLFILCILISCEKGNTPHLEIKRASFTDARDNKIYKTVKIVDQEWMAENLAYLPFVRIPEYGSDSVHCCYVYDHYSDKIDEAKTNENFKTYGVLYNFPAAINSCPDGWHLPSRNEWQTLIDVLGDGGYGYAGNKEYLAKSMSSEEGWAESRISGSIGYKTSENNSSGFNILPAGQLPYNGIFSDLSNGAYFWTSRASSDYSPTAYSWEFHYNSRQADRNFSTRISAFSVRCVRD